MKKLKLKLGGVKQMLTRDEMKRVSGGYGTEISCSYECVSNCEGQEHRIKITGRTTLTESSFCANSSSLCSGYSNCEVYADNCSCS